MNDFEYKRVRRAAQLDMAHFFGLCMTNNCLYSYPKRTGCDLVSSTDGHENGTLACEEIKNE